MQVVVWNSDDGTRTAGDAALFTRWRADPQLSIWVDLEPQDGAEQERLLREFGADATICQQALAERFPPKVEHLGDVTFILLRALNAQAETIESGMIQLAFLVGPRFLVTRHSDASPSIERARGELIGETPSLPPTCAALAVRIAAIVVSRFVPIMHTLEARLEDIEENMFENPTDDLLNELLVYKRQLKIVRRLATYHATIFDELRHEGAAEFNSVKRAVSEVTEQFERVVSLASLYNELANDLMNGYLSLASHRLNHIMKLLTIITCIFVPLSFLAGVYGMNFRFMPELSERYGYFVVVGVMATIALTLLAVFRRRKWI
jgi:magnesium transporter